MLGEYIDSDLYPLGVRVLSLLFLRGGQGLRAGDRSSRERVFIAEVMEELAGVVGEGHEVLGCGLLGAEG